MSRPARIAITAFSLSCVLALAGYAVQNYSSSGDFSVYAAKVEQIRQDVREGISLDLTKEDILRDPKLEADRADLMERIEEHRRAAQNADAETSVESDTH